MDFVGKSSPVASVHSPGAGRASQTSGSRSPAGPVVGGNGVRMSATFSGLGNRSQRSLTPGSPVASTRPDGGMFSPLSSGLSGFTISNRQSGRLSHSVASQSGIVASLTSSRERARIATWFQENIVHAEGLDAITRFNSDDSNALKLTLDRAARVMDNAIYELSRDEEPGSKIIRTLLYQDSPDGVRRAKAAALQALMLLRDELTDLRCNPQRLVYATNQDSAPDILASVLHEDRCRRVIFRPSFFQINDADRVQTLLHELAHLAFGCDDYVYSGMTTLADTPGGNSDAHKLKLSVELDEAIDSLRRVRKDPAGFFDRGREDYPKGLRIDFYRLLEMAGERAHAGEKYADLFARSEPFRFLVGIFNPDSLANLALYYGREEVLADATDVAPRLWQPSTRNASDWIEDRRRAVKRVYAAYKQKPDDLPIRSDFLDAFLLDPEFADRWQSALSDDEISIASPAGHAQVTPAADPVEACSAPLPVFDSYASRIGQPGMETLAQASPVAAAILRQHVANSMMRNPGEHQRAMARSLQYEHAHARLMWAVDVPGQPIAGLVTALRSALDTLPPPTQAEFLAEPIFGGQTLSRKLGAAVFALPHWADSHGDALIEIHFRGMLALAAIGLLPVESLSTMQESFVNADAWRRLPNSFALATGLEGVGWTTLTPSILQELTTGMLPYIESLAELERRV